MPDTDPLERILSRLDDLDRRLIRIETKVCRALEGAGYDPATGQRAPLRQMAALTHAQRDAARQ